MEQVPRTARVRNHSITGVRARLVVQVAPTVATTNNLRFPLDWRGRFNDWRFNDWRFNNWGAPFIDWGARADATIGIIGGATDFLLVAGIVSYAVIGVAAKFLEPGIVSTAVVELLSTAIAVAARSTAVAVAAKLLWTVIAGCRRRGYGGVTDADPDVISDGEATALRQRGASGRVQKQKWVGRRTASSE